MHSGRTRLLAHRWPVGLIGQRLIACRWPLSLIAVAIVLAGAATAYGFLPTTGKGTGTAHVAELHIEAQAVLATDPNSALLLPGHTADAIVRVHNPNPLAVRLFSVTGNGKPTASNGCSPTGVSFTDQNGLNNTLPAGATVLIRLPGSVSMSDASATACQGASFDIPVTVTVHQ